MTKKPSKPLSFYSMCVSFMLSLAARRGVERKQLNVDQTQKVTKGPQKVQWSAAWTKVLSLSIHAIVFLNLSNILSSVWLLTVLLQLRQQTIITCFQWQSGWVVKRIHVKSCDWYTVKTVHQLFLWTERDDADIEWQEAWVEKQKGTIYKLRTTVNMFTWSAAHALRCVSLMTLQSWTKVLGTAWKYDTCSLIALFSTLWRVAFAQSDVPPPPWSMLLRKSALSGHWYNIERGRGEGEIEEGRFSAKKCTCPNTFAQDCRPWNWDKT